VHGGEGNRCCRAFGGEGQGLRVVEGAWVCTICVVDVYLVSEESVRLCGFRCGGYILYVLMRLCSYVIVRLCTYVIVRLPCARSQYAIV
jgi:hypothetical protein